MPGPKCVVELCTNNGYKCKNDGKTLAFHRFPRDPGLKQQWVEKCGKDAEFLTDYAFVCSDHFNAEDYKRDMQAELLGYVGRRKLKPNAVPSLNLPFEEDTSLSPAEKAKAEKEKHEKLIQDCLSGDNKYIGILSFEMFKKMRYKNTRRRKRPRNTDLPDNPGVYVLKIESDDTSGNFDLNSSLNEHRMNNFCSSEDDTNLTIHNESFQSFLHEDLPIDTEGTSCFTDETTGLETDVLSDNPDYLKGSIKKLEQKVKQQESFICKLKRGILREKKMMEKIILATNAGYAFEPRKKKRVQFDEKARSALLEIYSLDPDSYSRFANALNLPTKAVLSSWDPEICPPSLMKGTSNQRESEENLENSIVEPIEC